jgi:predicted nucleic acid-binding protein
MASGVLLDTSYLISLVDSSRANHSVAVKYYRLMVDNQYKMYLSSIVASEFSIRQPITDLPLNNLRALPFNIPHAMVAAELHNSLKRDQNDSRDVVKDDVKLMAQASKDNIPFILTEDESTLYKYCKRLQTSNLLKVRAIKLSDGYDPSFLREDGQKDLTLE